MKTCIQRIIGAGICAAVFLTVAHTQTMAVGPGRAGNLSRAGGAFQPNSVIIGNPAFSGTSRARIRISPHAFSNVGQLNRGLGIGAQGSGTTIGQQGTTLIGPAPVFPPPSPVTPFFPAMQTPVFPPITTPPVPALTPQGVPQNASAVIGPFGNISFPSRSITRLPNGTVIGPGFNRSFVGSSKGTFGTFNPGAKAGRGTPTATGRASMAPTGR